MQQKQQIKHIKIGGQNNKNPTKATIPHLNRSKYISY